MNLTNFVKQLQQNSQELRSDNEENQTAMESNIEDNPNYQQQFENKNKIYELNSMVNESNFRLQKMYMEFYTEIMEERVGHEKVLGQRNILQQDYRKLMDDMNVVSTVMEAEKNAKNKISKQLKSFVFTFGMIQKLLGLGENSDSEAIVEQIKILKDFKLKQIEDFEVKQKDNLSKFQILEKEMQRLKIQYEKSLQNFVQQDKSSKINFQKELNSIKKQNQKLIQQINRERSQNLILNQQNQKLKQTEKCYSQLKVEFEQLRKKEIFEQVEKQQLAQKMQKFILSNRNYKEDKSKYEQMIGKLKFDKEILQKKLLLVEQKYTEESKAYQKLQQSKHQIQEDHKNLQIRFIQTENTCQQFKRKLHIFEIYKEKYQKKTKLLKEEVERSQQLNYMAEQYAEQIQRITNDYNMLEEQLTIKDDQTTNLENELEKIKTVVHSKQENIEELYQQIQERQSKLLENQKQISKLQGLKKGELSNIDLKNLYENNEKQLIKHYQNLLLKQDKNRINLNKELSQIKIIKLSLKSSVDMIERDNIRLKEENKMLLSDKQYLQQEMSHLQKCFTSKIENLRGNYKQIQKNSSQNKNKQYNLRIISVFSFSQKQTKRVVENKSMQSLQQESSINKLTNKANLLKQELNKAKIDQFSFDKNNQVEYYKRANKQLKDSLQK